MSKRKLTIPAAVVLGFLPMVNDIRANIPGFGLIGSIEHTGAGLFGYDTVGKRWAGLGQAKAAGLYPIIGGFIVHKLATKFGFNRMLANAGVPLIRI